VEIPGLHSSSNVVRAAGDLTGQPSLDPTGNRTGGAAEEPKALEKAAREFEGVFLNTLLKAMRRTVPENELFNSGGATKFYRQMHDAEIARNLATGRAGMGIADMIVRQLSRVPAPETDPATAGPRALVRYRQVDSLGPADPARIRLTRLAAQQETAVADTLNRFGPEIETAARDSGLDPALVLSVVMEESGGDPEARSPKGALGLMQLMPDTAHELGVANRTDAAQNLQGGARYLAALLNQFAGELDVALAAYNAGPGTVTRLGGRIPDYPETRRYVHRVLARYEQLGGGSPEAPAEP
jgi:soluble lytic murein transglycosylase-like protein